MGTIIEKGTKRERLRRLARRFLRSDRGVTVIEFALVGPLFFAIIGATVETALAFFAGYALDAAIIDTSRLIRTGQSAYVTQSSSSADNYRAAVCAQLYGIFDCDALRISVREISSFASFADHLTVDPLDPASGAWTMTERYDGAMGSRTMMIEAYYKWPVLINVPGLIPNATADGKRLLAATHVIRTEPFPS